MAKGEYKMDMNLSMFMTLGGGGGAWVDYLRDTQGNLVLDSQGNPIEIIGS